MSLAFLMKTVGFGLDKVSEERKLLTTERRMWEGLVASQGAGWLWFGKGLGEYTQEEQAVAYYPSLIKSYIKIHF